MKIIKNKIGKCVVSAGLTTLFLHSATAQAVTTISFDGLPSSWEVGVVKSVTDSGFTVEATGSGFFISTGSAGDCTPECPEKDSQYMATQTGSEAIAVYKNDAGLFDLHSFEYAERQIGSQHASQIHVTGFVQDGNVVTATFFVDGINDGSGPLNDFQTGVLPDTFRNLKSIQFVSDAFTDRYSLDTIVTLELDAEVIHPTVCVKTYPITTVVTTGGGQSSTVNEQVQLKFSGHLMTQSGLTSGGKNSVTICPGTRVDYEVHSSTGAAICTLNGSSLQSTGKLSEGQKIICHNKPEGSDTDRFSIKSGR